MSRFQKISPYIILDKETNLQWCTEVPGPIDWHTANDSEWISNQLKDLGLPQGFRLPTSRELMTLIDHNRHNPASSFPNMLPKRFWSSSSYAADPSFAWIVNFGNGLMYDYDKDGSNHLRCVRRGPIDSLKISSSPSNPQVIGRF